MALPPVRMAMSCSMACDDRRRGPAHFSGMFLELLIKVAAPPFVIFERWEAQTPRSHRIRGPSALEVGAASRGEVTVRAPHPSKTAMGGAASVVVVSTKEGQRWASPLTSQGWATVFQSAPNDAIVPVNSQLNGNSDTSATLLTFPNVIHSPGIEALGFGPPSELDGASGIPDWVVDLLNESTDGNEFHH
jgi:hypothetical protein